MPELLVLLPVGAAVSVLAEEACDEVLLVTLAALVVVDESDDAPTMTPIPVPVVLTMPAEEVRVAVVSEVRLPDEPAELHL